MCKKAQQKQVLRKLQAQKSRQLRARIQRLQITGRSAQRLKLRKQRPVLRLWLLSSAKRSSLLLKKTKRKKQLKINPKKRSLMKQKMSLMLTIRTRLCMNQPRNPLMLQCVREAKYCSAKKSLTIQTTAMS